MFLNDKIRSVTVDIYNNNTTFVFENIQIVSDMNFGHMHFTTVKFKAR